MKKRLRSLMAMVIATVILASSTFIGSVGYDTSQSLPGSSVIQTDSVLQTVESPQTDNGISSINTASILDFSSVPDAVGYDNAVSSSHVQRLYDAEGEELNKVVFLSCGYSAADVKPGAFTNAEIDSILDSDTNNIFVSRSHGTAQTDSDGTLLYTYVQLNDTGAQTGSYRSDGSISTLDLTNMKLVMFIACETGVGGENAANLPSVAVEQGAATAIGFKQSIGCSIANNWTEALFELLSAGATVGSACETLANSPEYSSTTMADYVICGNRNTKLT